MKPQVLNIDYQVDLNPNYIRNKDEAMSFKFIMNDYFATPTNSYNYLLRVKLPFANMNGIDMMTTVPESTSQFRCKFLTIICLYYYYKTINRWLIKSMS